MRAIPLLIAVISLSGCTDTAPYGPSPIYQPDSLGFFDTPWPSDRRLDEDGTLDVAAFPNPWQVNVLEAYLALADVQVGFGTNSPIYLRFESSPDLTLLPTPDASLVDGSSLQLVNIDPTSATWGQRMPLQWNYIDEQTPYQPEDLLAVAPVHGFPLRPATKYALIVTTAAASPHEAWAQAAWDTDHPDHDADLRHALFFLDLATEDVAIATTFTTTDPVAEMAEVARFLQQDVGPPDLDEPLELLFEHETYTAWRTHYASPRLTHGIRPYLSEGGNFIFDDAGRPVIDGWDDMRLAVCTPNDDTAPPEGGWPVVIYQHGTGGAYRSFCNSSAALEVANRLGAAGLIGLGIDQPLHGTRSGDQEPTDIAHFNIVNPQSGTTNFRQGAADLIYLARALARRPATFTGPSGRSFVTDPDQVLFMGHSQGGLTGGIAAPFLGNDTQAVVLSGAGGVLAITITLRKDILDFAELLRDVLEFSEDEELTVFHPTLALIQGLVEVTDPVNYAPFWFATQGSWVGHTPARVLLTSGLGDEATPYSTAVALAAAGRLPWVAPAASRGDAMRLRGIEDLPMPQMGNTRAFDGSLHTSGFMQFADGDHFVVFTDPQASDLYVNFLRSTADGNPTLWFAPLEDE